MERNLRMIIVADNNTADGRSLIASIAQDPAIPQTIVTPALVRHIIPIRATPAVGVMFWSSDLQGLAADVENFAAYIKGEAEVKEAAHVAQRYIPDEVALTTPAVLFDAWSADGVAYVKGDIRQYDGLLYRCIQAHTSQSDWTPSAAASLWARIADPTQEWPEWIQPAGAHDAYAKGAKVSHNGKHWISTAEANVWEPGAYGWEEAT